jgi:hypothetical protein
MNHVDLSLVRVALAIHGRLVRPCASDRLVELPTSVWCHCETLVRQIRRAELHQWRLAADRLREELYHSITSLQSRLLELDLRPAAPGPYVASPSDVYHDLAALQDQFDQFNIDREGYQLAVTTPPITLEGRYLGPFEVRLDWQRSSFTALPDLGCGDICTGV